MNMSKLLLIVSAILIMVWAVAFFEFHERGLIHILIVIAILILSIRLLYNKSSMKY